MRAFGFYFKLLTLIEEFETTNSLLRTNQILRLFPHSTLFLDSLFLLNFIDVIFLCVYFFIFLILFKSFSLANFYFYVKFQIAFFQETHFSDFFFCDLFKLGSNERSWIYLIGFSCITNRLDLFQFANSQDARTVQRVRRAKWLLRSHANRVTDRVNVIGHHANIANDHVVKDRHATIAVIRLLS